MSHELEFVNGQAQMAYAKRTEMDVPWHGLGVAVDGDLTPLQMLEAAGLDWRVNTQPCFTMIDDKRVKIGKQALIRDRDNKVLDIISDDWKPMQNEDAFKFFNEFVASGDMTMETAGSLKDGKIVWALAAVKESFELFGGKDKVDAYLHFTNPHSYGQSIDVRFTSIRVVCANTLTASLNKQSKNMVKVSHRREFNADEVKETMGVAREKLQLYKEAATFLSQKRYKNEDIVEYFARVFPVLSSKSDPRKDLSKSAGLALSVMDTQPGAELGSGTWWQAFNATTYCVDHLIGRSADTRLQSAWYGTNSKLKVKALDLALEMAS